MGNRRRGLVLAWSTIAYGAALSAVLVEADQAVTTPYFTFPEKGGTGFDRRGFPGAGASS